VASQLLQFGTEALDFFLSSLARVAFFVPLPLQVVSLTLEVSGQRQ
jgi:hypothetical protein